MMLKNAFDFLCRITYYTVRFFHILITFHEGTRWPGEVRYRRKDFMGMHYTGTGDLGTIYANV